MGDLGKGEERNIQQEWTERERCYPTGREVSVFIKTPVLSKSLMKLSDDSLSVGKRII